MALLDLNVYLTVEAYQDMKSVGLNENLRYMARRILHCPVVVSQSSLPHVFLFATRRGGSTLIRDAIWSQSGFDYIDEPFDYHKANPYRNMFGNPDSDHVFLTPENRQSILQYTEGLLSGRFYVRSQWNWFDSRFSRRVNRFVLKMHCVKTFADTLVDAFGERCTPLAFFRHPIPTSLSIAKIGWANNSAEFLNNSAYCDEYLTSEQIKLSTELLHQNDPTLGLVVNWMLENVRLVQIMAERKWPCAFYESLVASPAETFSAIQSPLKLNPVGLDAFQESLSVKTRSVFDRDSASAIARLSGSQISSRWLSSAPKSLLKDTQQLLDVFNISFYKADSPDPQVAL